MAAVPAVPSGVVDGVVGYFAVDALFTATCNLPLRPCLPLIDVRAGGELLAN